MNTPRLTLLAGLLLLPSLAFAVPNLKFDDPIAPGGTVSYDGGGGPAIGTNIQFQTITGLDTPANAGITLICTGCLLNFTTGANVTEGPALWDFGPGGTITVVGEIISLGVPAGTTLLTGTWAGTPNMIQAGPLGLFAGGGLDVKDETLATFFGLTPDFIHATTNITAPFTVGVDGSFLGTVVNADLNNLSVPNPSALLFMGTGLLGLVAMRRRLS